jgi:hypothetical protein
MTTQSLVCSCVCESEATRRGSQNRSSGLEGDVLEQRSGVSTSSYKHGCAVGVHHASCIIFCASENKHIQRRSPHDISVVKDAH